MNTEYAHTITKEEVEELPMEKFEGRIFVLTNEKDANRAVAYLERYPVLGFDTETRPNFRRGRRNKIALVQLSTEDTCFLFRLNRMGFPASLKKLLGNADVKKVGLSLRDDFGAIRKRTEKGLLSGLYEFPWNESGKTCSGAVDTGLSVTHIFTHIKLTLRIYTMQSDRAPLPDGFFAAPENLADYPFSTLMKKVLSAVPGKSRKSA